MKVLKKLAVILPTVMIIFVLVLLILITTSIKRDDTPSLFGYSALVVVTDSMEPALEVDDLIIIKPSKEYKVGDVITFYSEILNQRVRITHRIIEIDIPNSIYITQGDKAYADLTKRAHPDYVEEVPFEDVIGKMVLKSSIVGSIASVEFLNNKNLIFGMIFGVLIIMIAFQAVDIIKHKKELHQDETKNEEIDTQEKD